MERIDTPEKVKEYLNQESIEYQEDDPDKWLLTLATRRLKRRLFEAGDDSLKRSCNVTPSISLTALICAMERLRAKSDASGGKEEMWPTVRFTIVDIADPSVVRLKHRLNGGCTGNIVDSQCKRCHSHVPGVLGYSFKVLAADVDTPARVLGVQFSHKGGQSLLKMQPGKFNDLDAEAQGKIKEMIEGVPIVARLIVSFDPEGEDYFICAFDAYVEE